MKDKIRPIIFYIIFFLFTFGFFIAANMYDFDLWARLIAGMGFVQSGHVLKQDFLSYTPTHTWYDHEWGSGVIFYLTQHYFSHAGILLLQVILMFSIFFFITKIVELRGVKTTTPYNFLFYYFAFIAMSYLMSNPIRCQMFSFLFFTVFLYILELARKGRTKALWAMPVIMLIWNNLHGGCVSGIGLILIYIVGEFLNKKPVKQYLTPLALSVLVLPINPWGFVYLKFLLRANTMQRPDIMEWWGLFCKYNALKFFKFKIFAAVLILAESYVVIKQVIAKNFEFDKTKFLVLAVTLFIAIEHVKLVPFAVISMTCFLYDDFYTVFNSLTKNFFNKIANVKDVFIFSLILFFALVNINSRVFNPILHWGTYPVREIEFLKINNIKGNLLINFGLGSYASYKLYPNNKIYMDGRYEEVYYDYEMALFKKFYLVQKNWDEILNRFPTDIIIVEKYYPIFDTLRTGMIYQQVADKKNVMIAKNTGIKHNQKWTLVFEDNVFGLFVKTKDVKKNYKIPPSDLNYYKKTLFDTQIKFKK